MRVRVQEYGRENQYRYLRMFQKDESKIEKNSVIRSEFHRREEVRKGDFVGFVFVPLNPIDNDTLLGVLLNLQILLNTNIEVKTPNNSPLGVNPIKYVNVSLPPNLTSVDFRTEPTYKYYRYVFYQNRPSSRPH